MFGNLIAIAFLVQQIPPPVGVVNDFAHVLTPSASAHIQQIASDVRNKSRGEIAVVTLRDIGDQDPAQVALLIGRQWKVGKIGNPGDPTRNAGAVILLVPKETSGDGRGHCFIATGQGTEGFITDADAGDICREATPDFRQRDYSDGLDLVTYRTAQRFADEFKFSLDTALSPSQAQPEVNTEERGGRGGITPTELFIGLLIVFFILRLVAGGRRGCGCVPIPFFFGGGGGGWSSGGGGWGGGGGGGGFGGVGGGGGFGGGGGGSSW